MLEKLNITYSPVEDRLLLRALCSENGEYRIWMTRRYCGIMLEVLTKLINEAGGMLDIASSSETLEQLKAGAISETPLPLSGATALPLGEAGILGFRIDYGRSAAGKSELQLLPEQGSGLKLSLDRSLLFMFYNMLEQGMANADWKLNATLGQRHPVH